MNKPQTKCGGEMETKGGSGIGESGSQTRFPSPIVVQEGLSVRQAEDAAEEGRNPVVADQTEAIWVAAQLLVDQ